MQEMRDPVQERDPYGFIIASHWRHDSARLNDQTSQDEVERILT